LAYHLAAHLEAKGLLFRHWIAVSMKGTFPRGKKLYPAHYALLYFTKGLPATFNRDEVRQPVPACRHCGGDVKDYGGHRIRVLGQCDFHQRLVLPLREHDADGGIFLGCAT
jgi:site-specific DNA-methyltransferase (adenine-specific)